MGTTTWLQECIVIVFPRLLSPLVKMECFFFVRPDGADCLAEFLFGSLLDLTSREVYSCAIDVMKLRVDEFADNCHLNTYVHLAEVYNGLDALLMGAGASCYLSGWLAAHSYICFRRTCRVAHASAVMTRYRSKILRKAFSHDVPSPEIVNAIIVHWLSLRGPYSRAWNHDEDTIAQRNLWFEALRSMKDVYRFIPLEMRRAAYSKANRMRWRAAHVQAAVACPILVSSDEDLF